MITPTELTKEIQEYQSKLCRDYALFCAARTILARYEGKPITRRMVTALKASWPLASIAFSNDSLRTISIWGHIQGRERPYDDRVCLWMSGQNGAFSLDAFDKSNVANLLDQQRADTLEILKPRLAEVLESYGEVLAAIDRHNKFLAELEDGVETGIYPISKLTIQIKE